MLKKTLRLTGGALVFINVTYNKMVGDTGFEPVTSSVCRRPRSKRKRRK